MKANSSMIWPKALECISIPTEANLLVIGTKISNMASAKKGGTMEVNIKGSIKMLPKKAKANTAGPMETDMLANGKTTCLTGKVSSSGMITECSWDNG